MSTVEFNREWKQHAGLTAKEERDSYHIRKGLNDMLNRQQWTYFFTFTTRYQLSKDSARTLIERTWKNWKTDCPTVEMMFWVSEPHKQTGYHLHGLIRTEDNGSFQTSDANLNSLLKHNEWAILIKSYQKSAGFGMNEFASEGWHRNKIERISNYETAKNYVTKYVTKDCLDWDLLVY